MDAWSISSVLLHFSYVQIQYNGEVFILHIDPICLSVNSAMDWVILYRGGLDMAGSRAGFVTKIGLSSSNGRGGLTCLRCDTTNTGQSLASVSSQIPPGATSPESM